MSVLKPPSTGNLVRDLEQHVTRERELGAWGFSHLVRYLRAIVLALNPQPHKCTRAVLDAATHALDTDTPSQLRHLVTMPPEGNSRAVAARNAANDLALVVSCWAGWDGVVKFRDRSDETAERVAYEHAKRVVARIENDALQAGLTVSDLYLCATAAFGDAHDPNRRDAAAAAFAAGYFKLGQDILNDVPGENN